MFYLQEVEISNDFPVGFDVKSETFSDGAELELNEETNDDDDIPLSQFLKSCGLGKAVVDKKRKGSSKEERNSKPRGRTLKVSLILLPNPNKSVSP